ncbi:FHA domain-containing protein [Acaryochloris marina NIES-2412]|uniref:FHA domain-containing protein n=1 Tax=Acaryochloris marina TaxID=155978 RepID=UPI00405A07DA
MQIQLVWTDPNSGKPYQPRLQPPVALGNTFNLMPATHQGQAVSRVVLHDDMVQAFHALLEVRQNNVWLCSQADSQINGVTVTEGVLTHGDRIQMGPFELTFTLVSEPATTEDTLQDQASVVSADHRSTPLSGMAQISAERPEQTTQANRSSGEWVCDRTIGFLFKRPCDRTTALGCPYCNNGQSKLDQDPYWLDYDLYPNFGTYRPGSWGYEYYRDRAYYCYNRESRNIDFTEADAASFEEESDTDYEMNFGAS